MTFRERFNRRLLRYLTEGSPGLAVPAGIPETLGFLAGRLARHPATLLLAGGRWRVRWPQGFDLYYTAKFNSVTHHYVATGSYEDAELNLVQANLRADSVFLDIGANVGLFSLLAARVIQTGRIFSFEPLPETHRDLLANIALNRAADRIEPLALALSDRSGEGYITSDFHASNFLVDASAVSPKQPIALSTLDAFAAARRFERIDLIKLDVEGCELSVLRGGLATLRRFQPMLLVELIEQPVEFHERAVPDHHAAIELLAGLGYQHYVVDDHGAIVPGPAFKAEAAARSYHNYLFYLPGRHEPVLGPAVTPGISGPES